MDLMSGHPPLDPARTRYQIPRVAKVQLCRAIAPETTDFGLGTLTSRYAALVEPLPLAGADVMHLTHSGTIALVERLRDEMPWIENAIVAIERHLLIQLWADDRGLRGARCAWPARQGRASAIWHA